MFPTRIRRKLSENPKRPAWGCCSSLHEHVARVRLTHNNLIKIFGCGGARGAVAPTTKSTHGKQPLHSHPPPPRLGGRCLLHFSPVARPSLAPAVTRSVVHHRASAAAVRLARPGASMAPGRHERLWGGGGGTVATATATAARQGGRESQDASSSREAAAPPTRRGVRVVRSAQIGVMWFEEHRISATTRKRDEENNPCTATTMATTTPRCCLVLCVVSIRVSGGSQHQNIKSSNLAQRVGGARLRGRARVA